MSCVNVTVGNSVGYDAVCNFIKSTPIVDTSFNALNSVANIECSTSAGSSEIINPTVRADISMEIVCGIDGSLMLLCSQDGELLTIDGKYIIVRTQ